VTKANFEWNMVNLSKQFAIQIPIQRNSNFFELGQIRISKITFDFSKQLEKLPT